MIGHVGLDLLSRGESSGIRQHLGIFLCSYLEEVSKFWDKWGPQI